MCARTHTQTHTYSRACAREHTQTHTHTHARTHTHTCTYIQHSRARTHTHTHGRIYKHTRTQDAFALNHAEDLPLGTGHRQMFAQRKTIVRELSRERGWGKGDGNWSERAWEMTRWLWRGRGITGRLWSLLARRPRMATNYHREPPCWPSG